MTDSFRGIWLTLFIFFLRLSVTLNCHDWNWYRTVFQILCPEWFILIPNRVNGINSFPFFMACCTCSHFCIAYRFLCDCGAFPKDEAAKQELQALSKAYRDGLTDLVNTGRYDTREDFTVVIQPFFTNTDIPNKVRLLGIYNLMIRYYLVYMQ